MHDVDLDNPRHNLGRFIRPPILFPMDHRRPNRLISTIPCRRSAQRWMGRRYHVISSITPWMFSLTSQSKVSFNSSKLRPQSCVSWAHILILVIRRWNALVLWRQRRPVFFGRIIAKGPRWCPSFLIIIRHLFTVFFQVVRRHLLTWYGPHFGCF